MATLRLVLFLIPAVFAITLGAAAPAAAQTINCSTTYYGPPGGPPGIADTTCSTPPPPGSCQPYEMSHMLYIPDCWTGDYEDYDPATHSFVMRHHQGTAQPGLNYIDSSGAPASLPQGTFLKADDSPAIYLIWNQQFHVFQTWDSFLRNGGRADLSNVVRWSTVSNWPASYFSDPMPS